MGGMTNCKAKFLSLFCRRYSTTVMSSSSMVSTRRISSSAGQSHFETVGFIGLGNMGSSMANNLIKAGYNLVVHDINLNAMKKFSEKGVPTKETPFEVMKSSDVVITMLPSSSHVWDVYMGNSGLLHDGNTLRPWLLIDSSTVDPQTSRRISLSISKYILKEKKGALDHPVMLDAPVSGGVLGAEAATLTFMVGGLEDAYLASKSLLLAMGKNTIYCGGAGNGAAAKICNNLAMAVSMLGVSEALALGQSLGITARTLSMPGVMGGVPSSNNYEGGFSSKLMAKDLELAEASAKEVGFKCPFASQAREIYTALCKDGLESKDFSCVFRDFYLGKDETSGS